MKLSWNWLGQYVDLKGLTPQQVMHEFSTRTCEVEGLHGYGQGLEGVVVGKVLECGKHPNADKLSVTKVDVGAGEPLQIVCGAPNVRAGQSVMVAKPGVTLPPPADGTPGLTLKVAKLRGVESHGMILSDREMGLGEEHDGIRVLDAGSDAAAAAPGTPFYKVLPIADWIFEIDNKSVTHRPDLWGHYGFAREIAAIFERPLKPRIGEKAAKLPTAGKGIAVEIADATGCFRYLALEISGVQVGPSPFWLKNALAAIGQRSINNLVDLSNFLMFEIGQPTHAFDRAKIRDGKIIVRRAKAGEELTTLDGVKRKLTASDLLITDPQGPIGIAGVMGGQNSEIDTTTKSIVLESAVFDPVATRRTAQTQNLRSEASARFEKSLDPSYADEAVRRFAELISAVAPGAKIESLTETVADKKRGLPQTPTIALSAEKVAHRLGVTIPASEIASLLGRLQFQTAAHPKGGTAGTLAVTVPSFRATKDITIEEDLIEEVGRLYGFAKIPEQTLVAPVAPPPQDELEVVRRLVRQLKVRMALAHGFTETYHYSFLPDKLATRLGVEDKPYVTLANPIIQEQSRVRRSVLSSLLGDLEEALRQREGVRLFEIGKGYRPETASARGEPMEAHKLAGVWAWAKAPAGASPWNRAKGLVQSLLDGMRCGELSSGPTNAPPETPYLRRGTVWTWDVGGEQLAYLGELDPKIAKALGVTGPVLAFAIDIPLLAKQAGRMPKLQALPRFPGIRVDVALAVPSSISYRDTETAVRQAGGKLLAELQHFDTFRMKDGQKSFAFHALLQSPERTLSEKEEQEFIAKVAVAAKGLGGSLRG